ncbi:hypothetical protein LSAT2_018188 [Lamellibrachia satsuma]|nr:hypothetical protein LSAT2_018188 [Lamellibrachia satsuma]
MASRESAMAVLLVVLSGQLCCGEVQETDAAAKGSRHNAVLRRNPIKRHAVDKSSMRQKRAVWRVFVSRIEWRKTGNACIGNCEGLPDGNYQSCIGCNVHATCSNKKMSDRAPCSHSLVWDDGSKQCQNTSSTCKLLIGTNV